MNLTKLMEKVIGRQRARQQSRHEAYRSLVSTIANGQEPDADEVDELLGALGKSLDDLKTDVERFEMRRGLKAQVDQHAALAEEQQQLEKQIAAANLVLEEADRKHTEVTGPLAGRLQLVKQTISQVHSARQQLWDTCTDPIVLAELTEITTAFAEVSGRRAQLAADARRFREDANSDRSAIPFAKSELRISELRDNAAKRDKRAAALEAEVAKLIEEEAALKRREAAVRERMLEA